ncbi:MAG TPA: hypothetical protein PLC27_05310 [Saprospiraceae bacterium]|jgi:hypothetical protein|nr:hypothetical protein [Saprospiraceae bacterium]
MHSIININVELDTFNDIKDVEYSLQFQELKSYILKLSITYKVLINVTYGNEVIYRYIYDQELDEFQNVKE